MFIPVGPVLGSKVKIYLITLFSLWPTYVYCNTPFSGQLFVVLISSAVILLTHFVYT